MAFRRTVPARVAPRVGSFSSSFRIARCIAALVFAVLAAGCAHAGGSSSHDAGTPAASDAAGTRTDATTPLTDASTDAGASSALDAGPAQDAATAHLGCGAGSRSTLRVIFLGNSQVYYFDIASVVQMLAASGAPDCPRLEVETLAKGGASLRTLWEEPLEDGTRVQDRLAAGGYDVVVITESIDLADTRPPFPDQFYDYATRIVNVVRAHGATPIFYATAYVEDHDALPSHPGFNEIADPQIELGRRLDVHVAPGGLAWLRAWAAQPSLDLYHSDRGHPGPRGIYISACTLYAVLTGASPVGLTSDISFTNSDPATWPCEADDRHDCPHVTSTEAALFQRVAWEQVQATEAVRRAAP